MKRNCLGMLGNNMYMINNNYYITITHYLLLSDDVWYHIKYLKYINNILSLFLSLFYMKPDTITIIMSGITDLLLHTHINHRK